MPDNQIFSPMLAPGDLSAVFPGYVLLVDQGHGLRFANNFAQRVFGRCEGRKCYELLRNRKKPCVPCAPFEVFRGQAGISYEWGDAGRKMAFQVHTHPFAGPDGEGLLLKLGVNTTNMALAEQARTNSEQRYRNLTDNLTIGIAAVDQALRISNSNTQMLSWFGRSAMEGATLCSLFGRRCAGQPADCPDCRFSLGVKNGRREEHEFSMNVGGGEKRFRLLICPTTHFMLPRRSAVILLEDITERLATAEKLHRAERLEALNALAGGIAHEINQPLSALSLYAGGLQMLLEKEAALPAETARQRLALILDQTEKMREIIAQMRALAMQGKAPPPGAVDFAEVVSGVLATLSDKFQAAGVRLILELQADLPPVRAVTVQLEQVLINLLNNAAHAVEARPKGRRVIRVAAALEEAGQILVKVADSGPGMQGLESKAFDPFFSTREPHKGMGLGLSIAHAFVSSWGGQISITPRAEPLGGAVLAMHLEQAGG